MRLAVTVFHPGTKRVHLFTVPVLRFDDPAIRERNHIFKTEPLSQTAGSSVVGRRYLICSSAISLTHLTEKLHLFAQGDPEQILDPFSILLSY